MILSLVGEARGETWSGISASKIFAGVVALTCACCCLSTIALVALDPSGHRALAEQVDAAKLAFPAVHPRPALRDQTPAEVSAPLRRSVDPSHTFTTREHEVALRRCFQASTGRYGMCLAIDTILSENTEMVRDARSAIRGDRIATPLGFPRLSFEDDTEALSALGRSLISRACRAANDNLPERTSEILDGLRIIEDANFGRGLVGLATIAEATQAAASRLSVCATQMKPQLAREVIGELTSLLEHRFAIGQFMETSVIRTCEEQLSVYETEPIPFVARMVDEHEVYSTAEAWCARPSDFRSFGNTFEDARRLIAEAALRRGTVTVGAIDMTVREPDEIIRSFMRGTERMRLVLAALRVVGGARVAEVVQQADVRGARREPQVSWRNTHVCMSHEPFTSRRRARELLWPAGWGGSRPLGDRAPFAVCLPRDTIDETGAPPRREPRRVGRRSSGPERRSTRRGNEVLSPR